MPSTETIPLSEEMLTTDRPAPSAIAWRAKACVHRNVPLRQTSTTQSQLSSGVSMTSDMSPAPAQLTRWWTVPKRSAATAKAACTSAFFSTEPR
jgi:hypothetical protein